MNSYNVYAVGWPDVSARVQQLIPPLTGTSHKGEMGRVGVIGGCGIYTGAPYYAAKSALLFGADLSFVFCSRSAAGPIKSYSPELIVAPVFGDTDEDEGDLQDLTTALPANLHSLVVGPGLGRRPSVLAATAKAMRTAVQRNASMVVDADGLWLLNGDPFLLAGCRRCVLTPNQAEFERLVAAVRAALQARRGPLSERDTWLLAEMAGSDDTQRVHALSLALGGVAVLRKGREDLVCAGGDVFVVRAAGCPRRCGGQGDILAGALGTAMHWAALRADDVLALTGLQEAKSRSAAEEPRQPSLLSFSEEDACDAAEYYSLPAPPRSDRPPAVEGLTDAAASDAIVGACILSSVAVKRAAELAFARRGRAMTSPDVLERLGEAFAELESSIA